MVSYIYHFLRPTCFPGSSAGKESTCNAEIAILFLGEEDPLEAG